MVYVMFLFILSPLICLLGDLPADAGVATAHFCQILPSALPPWRPDSNHPHWPGGLLGEMATDPDL